MGRAPDTVLITGGGRGIGFAAARAFAVEGFRVSIAQRAEARGRAAARRLRREDADALFIHADIADDGAAERAVRRTIAAIGKRRRPSGATVDVTA